MARKKKQIDPLGQPDLLDITARLRSGPCVPALREAVKAWRAGDYKGITDTTRLLLKHWFYNDHKLRNGAPFKYHPSQQEAIETLIFVWEAEKVRSRKALLERYAQEWKDIRLPSYDEFARYCVKMATGSGKTKVMSLAIAWQFLNAVREQDDIAKNYAKTFLLLAPNVIVLERLKTDFANGSIFVNDPVIPRELGIFWELDCIMRGDSERAPAEGALFLTNIQQFYERPEGSGDEEPDEMTAVLGSKPPANKTEMTDFGERIAKRAGHLLVVNDEAHHTHEEES
jgi:type III restriction enzyme